MDTTNLSPLERWKRNTTGLHLDLWEDPDYVKVIGPGDLVAKLVDLRSLNYIEFEGMIITEPIYDPPPCRRRVEVNVRLNAVLRGLGG